MGVDMIEMLKRPGGQLASRPLHFFWLVDCSGSMEGEKMESVNYAIKQTIPDMRAAAADNPNAQLLIRTIAFSTGAKWVQEEPTPIEEFSFKPFKAHGLTDIGEAFGMLAEQLTIPPMSDRALPPVIVVLSDGRPTDDYRAAIQKLMALPWGKKAVKIAISIGTDADDEMLTEFTGNKDLVLQANNPQALVKMIKWASTVAKQVSAPNSNPTANSLLPLDMNTIPTEDDIDAADVW